MIQSNMKRASLSPRKNEIQEKMFYVKFQNLKNCKRKAFGLGKEIFVYHIQDTGDGGDTWLYSNYKSSEIMTWLERRKTEHRAKC